MILADTHGERALWTSVMAMAVADARKGDVHARAWLTTRSSDLALVCDLAGLDPEGVMRWARAELRPNPARSVGSERVRSVLNRVSAIKRRAEAYRASHAASASSITDTSSSRSSSAVSASSRMPDTSATKAKRSSPSSSSNTPRNRVTM